MSTTAIKPGLFTGAFKNWQSAAFRDLFLGGLSKHVSHKIATDYGSDLGRLMSSEAGKGFKQKIGKLSGDDGERKVSVAGAANIKASNAMSVIYVAQTLDKLFSENLLASRTMPELATELQEYVESCEDWAAEQVWEDEIKKHEIATATKE